MELSQPIPRMWPTSLAVGVALAWFSVLAFAMWLGANPPQPIAAWFVAYPMFALYPGVAALAAARAQSPSIVAAVATLLPTAVLWLALAPGALYDAPFGVLDRRLEYGIYTVVTGSGLLIGIRAGARVMRRPSRARIALGFVAAGAIFVTIAAVAFYGLLVFTTY